VTGVPLVSCVMPTRDRRAFARQAIWYFLRQDYPSKELVVLDDGDDAIEDLTRGDERIRYVRLLGRTTVGAKRNLGRDMARGEFVAHWDDDDWIGPARLSAQVSQLVATGADVHACGELLHYRVDAGDAWLLRARWPAAPDLPPGTLLYRRSVAEGRAFATANTGEQRPFLGTLAPERVHAPAAAGWYVAVVHRTNIAGRSLDDGRWAARPFEEVSERLGTDGSFYAGLRNRGRAAAARAGRARSADVSLASFFRAWDGYGLMAEYLALGMQRAGASVGVVALGVDDAGLSDELRELLASSRSSPGAPAVWFAPPHGAAETFPHTPDLFINTMWESDQLPPGWTAALNAARAVIVPTRFVASVCRRSGVEAPVEVVPEGVDPALYPYLDRPERAGLTTLLVGPLVHRKHVGEAVAAWQRAFAGDASARLILKGKLGVSFAVDDPRVEVITDTERTRGIAHWYAKADVLLALGNEGFGLPLVEGMASGLPVIALSSEGQGDVCADAGPLVLDVPAARWEPSDDTHYGPAGVRGVPDVDATVERLRWVARHRDEARDLGRQASAWAHRERNVWDKGPAMLEVIERRMGRRRPLRRLRTLWPIDPASLRPYVSALAAGLDRVRVVTAAPEVAGMRLLHVQHPGDPDADPSAATRIVETAMARVPVVVTEHAVVARIGPWERDATVLVATTNADAQALRRRWPDKWVEWIPYGCPPAAPTRRRTSRPRAVAIVGKLPAAESAARRERRSVVLLTPGQRPQLELARLLARDCDLVVFADAARARLDLGAALASGVPVLAAPDARLTDLDGAILQTADIAEGTARALTDVELRHELGAHAREHCHDHSWDRVAQRHLALWTALEAT
jgi:glycosyltransferase involved in cell wall biosynthesis